MDRSATATSDDAPVSFEIPTDRRVADRDGASSGIRGSGVAAAKASRKVVSPGKPAARRMGAGGLPTSIDRQPTVTNSLDAFDTSSDSAHVERTSGELLYSRTSERTTRRIQRHANPFDEHGSSRDAVEHLPGASRRIGPDRPVRSLKGRALGYLSRREYSRSELARKLAPYVEAGDDPEAVLDSLERDGWLSDARFAESLVHRRAPRVGVARILDELKRHVVDTTLVASVGEQLRETEFSRAQSVWRKKFGILPATPAERAKQARFLAARGFSRATIAKLLKGDDDFDGD